MIQAAVGSNGIYLFVYGPMETCVLDIRHTYGIPIIRNCVETMSLNGCMGPNVTGLPGLVGGKSMQAKIDRQR